MMAAMDTTVDQDKVAVVCREITRLCGDVESAASCATMVLAVLAVLARVDRAFLHRALDSAIDGCENSR